MPFTTRRAPLIRRSSGTAHRRQAKPAFKSANHSKSVRRIRAGFFLFSVPPPKWSQFFRQCPCGRSTQAKSGMIVCGESMYIHELKEWPEFHWSQSALTGRLAEVCHAQGRLLASHGTLGFPLREEATLQTLTQDVLKSSEIEGEKLDAAQCALRWPDAWVWTTLATSIFDCSVQSRQKLSFLTPNQM